MDLAAVEGDSPLTNEDREVNGDPFLHQYQPSELRIASEFLTTWLPFLSRDLCPHCSEALSRRIHSLDPPAADTIVDAPPAVEKSDDNYKDDGDDTNSLGSWKDPEEPSTSRGPDSAQPRMSWADMAAEEDELAAAEDEDEEEDREPKRVVNLDSATGEIRVSSLSPASDKVVGEKPKLSRDQREYLRFMNIKRKKDFICFERVKGKFVNVLDGLELHKGIFSAAEQKRIVDFVYNLQEMGRKGELKERTYTAPQKWMKGKGRVSIQFGCCYNYATDRNGNPPGILQRETVDPIPPLFKVIIRRLIRWHVLPPTCVPDSCVVNIYGEGDCIPPHIDNHDFVRPFCTVSFLSECNILFGTNLKAVGVGEFEGSFAIPLPVGSVLVVNGNSADVAKHCVPSVPTKRISITFRKMEETKRPISFVPEPDLQDIQPLSYEADKTKRIGSPKSEDHMRRKFDVKEGRKEGRIYLDHDYQSEPRYSNRGRRGSASKPRVNINLYS